MSHPRTVKVSLGPDWGLPSSLNIPMASVRSADVKLTLHPNDVCGVEWAVFSPDCRVRCVPLIELEDAQIVYGRTSRQTRSKDHSAMNRTSADNSTSGSAPWTSKMTRFDVVSRVCGGLLALKQSLDTASVKCLLLVA